jgi:hypothetical protein
MRALRRMDKGLLAIVAILGGSVATAQTTPGQSSAGAIEFANEKVSAFSLSLALGGIQSDNVARVSTNEESGSLATSTLNVKYRENTRRVRADVDADIGYEHYLDETFDDGVIGRADGAVTVGLVEETLEWTFNEQFRQARVDVFGADTPENRQNVNRFSTGPNARIRLNDELAIRLNGRFARVDYEEAAADGDRYSGAAALVWQLGTAREASFNVSSEAANFDNASGNVDYNRDRVYLRYEAKDSRTEFSADLGYMRIEDDLGKKADGAMLDVLMLRRVSSNTRFSVNLGTRFSDSGDIVSLTPGTDSGNLDPVVVLANPQPYEGRFVNVGWAFDRHRTGMGAYVEYRQERYTGASLFDRNMQIYGAYVNRRLTPRFELYARVHSSIEDFDNSSTSIKEKQGNAGLMMRLGRLTRIDLDALHRDRKSSNTATDFTENRLSLYLIWTPVSRSNQ